MQETIFKMAVLLNEIIAEAIDCGNVLIRARTYQEAATIGGAMKVLCKTHSIEMPDEGIKAIEHLDNAFKRFKA